jgi:hypothetical protein
MATAKALLITGLAFTLIGALVLAWFDLRGGRQITWGEAARGTPRRREARIGFPLIAFGSILQIAGVAAS